MANGGRGEIRTHGRLAPSLVFKTSALNHSATLPYCACKKVIIKKCSCYKQLCLIFCFFLSDLPGFSDIDRRGIQRVFKMSGVELLDHIHASPAVFGDLVNIGSFHEPKADIGMTKAVSRSDISIPVILQV